MQHSRKFAATILVVSAGLVVALLCSCQMPEAHAAGHCAQHAPEQESTPDCCAMSAAEFKVVPATIQPPAESPDVLPVIRRHVQAELTMALTDAARNRPPGADPLFLQTCALLI